MSNPTSATPRTRDGMTLVEVIIAMVILTGVLLGLGAFSARFAQANAQAHLVITANEIAATRLDEIRTQPTYVGIDALATPSKPDSVRIDNTWFARTTKVLRVGGIAAADSVDYKIMTVTVTNAGMRKVVAKSTAIAAF